MADTHSALALRDRVRFFADHAGYATPPGRMACALQLARDEAEGNARGFTVEWVHDPQGLDGVDEETRRRVDAGTWSSLGCIVTDPETGEDASLWGIVVSAFEDAYMKVVEAELYGDLLAERAKRGEWAARDVVTV